VNTKIILLIIALAVTVFSGCSKDGCTDEKATNYCSSCKGDDGSCNYIYGCTDPAALNYAPTATASSNCIYPRTGTYETFDACSVFPLDTYEMVLVSVNQSLGDYTFSNFANYFTSLVDVIIIPPTVILVGSNDYTGDTVLGEGTIAVDGTGATIINLNTKITDSYGDEFADCLVISINE
jgi:autotransporter-associated beta strand protein